MLTGLALVSTVLISLEFTTRLLEPVRSLIGTVVSPVRYVAHSPYFLGSELGEMMATRHMLQERNDLLEQRVLELSQTALVVSNLKRENEQMRCFLATAMETAPAAPAWPRIVRRFLAIAMELAVSTTIA